MWEVTDHPQHRRCSSLEPHQEQNFFLRRFPSGTTLGINRADFRRDLIEADPRWPYRQKEAFRVEVENRRKLHDEKSDVLMQRRGIFCLKVRHDPSTEGIEIREIRNGKPTANVLELTKESLWVDTIEEAMVLAETIANCHPLELLEMVAYRVWEWRHRMYEGNIKFRTRFSEEMEACMEEKIYGDAHQWDRFLHVIPDLSIH